MLILHKSDEFLSMQMFAFQLFNLEKQGLEFAGVRIFCLFL